MKLSYRLAIATAIGALGFAPGARAQGCVLCYTSLAASGPSAMHAFQMAMFVLLIPALLLFLGVFLLIFRRTRAKAPALPLSSSPAYSSRLAPTAKVLEGRA